MNYLVWILFGIVGFILGRKTSRVFSPKEEQKLKEMRKEAKEALSDRTRDRKEKILSYMKKELEHDKELEDCKLGSLQEGITREEVEELLQVSSKTARKYLNELEKEGEIKQIGSSGRDVHYILVV